MAAASEKASGDAVEICSGSPLAVHNRRLVHLAGRVSILDVLFHGMLHALLQPCIARGAPAAHELVFPVVLQAARSASVLRLVERYTRKQIYNSVWRLVFFRKPHGYDIALSIREIRAHGAYVRKPSPS